MKKHLTIISFLILSISAKAQNFYSVGYYDVTNGTIAALYKNNKRLYTAHITGMPSKAFKVVCNSEGDVFWLVNHYNYPSNTLHHTEILKNNQVYASTENQSKIHISDMYCLNDTIFYTGYLLNETGIAIATVWKGDDFATHWVLGDGIHASVIKDADVDKETCIPYYCGYITDSLQNATIWKGPQLLYKQEPVGYRNSSCANEISVDNGSVYTNGYYTFSYDGESCREPVIWKNDSVVFSATELDFLGYLYAHQGDYYFTYSYPHGMYYAVFKNHSELMELISQTGVYCICGDSDDIYMTGNSSGLGCIWKNFEVYLQPNNSSRLYDLVVSYANTGMNEIKENGFTVYPNPATGVLFVEASLPEQTFRITNLMGQTLLQGHITAETQQIDISNLPTGMYFISVGEQTVKFVVR